MICAFHVFINSEFYKGHGNHPLPSHFELGDKENSNAFLNICTYNGEIQYEVMNCLMKCMNFFYSNKRILDKQFKVVTLYEYILRHLLISESSMISIEDKAAMESHLQYVQKKATALASHIDFPSESSHSIASNSIYDPECDHPPTYAGKTKIKDIFNSFPSSVLSNIAIKYPHKSGVYASSPVLHR